MKDPNADSESSDQEKENSSPEHSHETDASATEEETLNEDAETGFEEQESEILPPEEKKKSGTGKVILAMILLLGGSCGYLYFNNLIPAEILNLISPKTVSSKPPALVAQTPPTPLPAEEKIFDISEEPIESPAANIEPHNLSVTDSVTDQEADHISGNSGESNTATNISGNSFDQAPEAEVAKEEELTEEPEEELLDEPKMEEPETITENKITEAINLPHEEPSTPESLESLAPRNEATQAYLDFIEFSAQKLVSLIKEGFNMGWNYLQKQLG
jgi:hypothetical protein